MLGNLPEVTQLLGGGQCRLPTKFVFLPAPSPGLPLWGPLFLVVSLKSSTPFPNVVLAFRF